MYTFSFNPHFRKGSDTTARNVGKRWIQFQSTLPQGKWHGTARRYICGTAFQSTLPQGKWLDPTGKLEFFTLISIHTSAREVTLKQYTKTLNGTFQSTLPQGKWHSRCWWSAGTSGFQSTLPQGKWLCCDSPRALTSSFQSTLPQGKWRTLN